MTPCAGETNVIGSCSHRQTVAIGIAVVLMPLASIQAAEQVVVEMRDGRELSGEVDVRTDQEALWLRNTAPSIVLRSAVAWNEIVHARHAGQILSVEELRALAPTVKTRLDDQFFADDSKPAGPRPRGTATISPGEDAPHRSRKIRTLRIEATIANWDADVEPDGLRVVVAPADALGEVVPVDGQITFKLIGQTQQTPTSERSRRRELFPELGRWTRSVRKRDFTSWGVTYDIPFRTSNPAFDLAVSPAALLHARLGVSGQGTFNASDAHVWLRDLSAIRDQLQMYGKRRFFPDENARRHGPGN